MAEYNVLHQEPRYKVDSFVNEVLGRTKDVLAEMADELERLLKDLVEQFKKFQADRYLLTLDDIKVAGMHWNKDGYLWIELQTRSPLQDDDPQPHQIVDEFV